ncbi:MAG: PEP-CTERM sorting domain-containing protein [Phycisphaerales bacterium]
MKMQATCQMGIITLGGLLLWATGTTARADTVVFQDSFNNGVVANSDSIVSYWTPSGTTSETNITGPLNMSATQPASGNVQSHLKTQTYSDLNFFNNKITIDFSLAATFTSGHSTGFSPGAVRFTLGSQPLLDEYGVNDGVQLNIQPYVGFDKVTLQYKQNAPNAPYIGLTTPVFIATTLSRFVLTLDATTYSLSLYQGDGSLFNAVPYTGALPLDPTQWGPSANANQYSHDSAMDIEVIATANSLNPATLSTNLTNLTISAIPEPATLGLLAMGGLFMLSRRRA